MTAPPLFSRQTERRRSNSRDAARDAGVAFETTLHEKLRRKYNNYTQAHWFLYYDKKKSRPNYCQPDGLFFLRKEKAILIVEIKTTHMIKAWFQLRKLYQPVLEKAFGSGWNYGVVEIVGRMTRDCAMPEELVMVSKPQLDDRFMVWPWTRS